MHRHYYTLDSASAYQVFTQNALDRSSKGLSETREHENSLWERPAAALRLRGEIRPRAPRSPSRLKPLP